MFKIESYIGPLLMGYLNKYVKLNEESFKLSLWGGDAVFHNVELQYDILEHLMPLPIGFKSGQVHELKIHIPWTKLGSESVLITLNTVECIMELKSDFIKKSKSDTSPECKKSERSSPEKQKYEKNIPPGYLKSYMYNIINNIHVKVNNLIIKFVEDDIVLSMNAKTLEYFPVTDQWTKGFISLSPENLKVYKVIEVFDLTICLDQMDSNGHIELYQEPILYRCSVECRFFTNYQSINSNSPNFLKFNIRFGDIDLNVSTTQMPMIRRLVELFYALYYGIINWDSIVGCGFSKQMIVPSNQIDRDPESRVETVSPIDSGDGESQKSWAAWAWSYVPSIFGEDDSLIDDDLIDPSGSVGKSKKIINFSVFYQSINLKIKKSLVTKPFFGSRRSNCNKTLTHFFTVVGTNIGLNVINNGYGFFNVQMGCTEIKLLYAGQDCVCGQELPTNQEHPESVRNNECIDIGKSIVNYETLSDFYLTGNLFSSDESSDVNVYESDLLRVASITSQESYSSLYSQEKCLRTFPALWFDYMYFMQIVKNNLEESQIDYLDLCNTDGIRESSQCNLYIGKSIVQIDSCFVHNLKEILKSLDTSRYLSYFRSSDDIIERHSIYYSSEEQVARIHEFVPVRQHNFCLTDISVKIHAFTESHQIPDQFPILELKTKSFKFFKVAPMYPKHLVGCVSRLSMNILKESSELISKCYLLKSFGFTGLSISFLLPDSSYSNMISKVYHETTILEPCDIDLNIKWLLYPELWKTSSIIMKDTNFKVSQLQLKLIPSHVKSGIVIIMSNYSWISVYMGNSPGSSSNTQMHKRLDDLTVQILGSHSSLLEACHKSFYKNKTYELHVSFPNFLFQTRETFLSYFVDVRIFQDNFLLFLQSPESSFVIPVLDNKLETDNLPTSKQSSLFVLSCQIPKQTRPVNCVFNIKCQIGSINFMFSQPLITWFIYPLMDLDLDRYMDSDIFPMFSTAPKKSSTNQSSITISDIRSMADGSSRPESPNIFYHKQPVPGHPRPINVCVQKQQNKKKAKANFLSNKTGWWNLVKDSCSKYFFLLQSLDVCINMTKSNIYITTISDLSTCQSQFKQCTQWVDNFLLKNEDNNSVFLIKMSRLALINSQRRDYLNESFQTDHIENLGFQSKPTSIIDSLPWELIFHDIRIDCLHSLTSSPSNYSKSLYDSILKPVSINCTLSATPKCSSPDKLDTLYSVSWGVHVDITEVQPTIKQIYLAKILKQFSTIAFGFPWTEFIKNIQCLVTGHYRIVQDNYQVSYLKEEQQGMKSNQSSSTKSTRKSKSSKENNESTINSSSRGRIIKSKMETKLIDEVETQFKLSFWIQCTLSQFQLVVMNDRVEMDHNDSSVYVMLQIDDATSCIDVQEKFVEIKGKLGSILCQIGVMKNEKIISEIPILKAGSKFICCEECPYSYKSTDESQHILDDISAENIIRHCLSIAVIRTTPNNLSKRPINTYHQFKDNESFKSYLTEFTGNFSTSISTDNKYQSYVTQISSIIEPFDLYFPPFFLKQCIDLSNSFVTLCNQVLQSSVRKWSLPNRKASPINASSIKNEPYFISEDMPQFYLLVKSSRIILPRYQSKNFNVFDQSKIENGCIIATWKKISVQPFSNNAISRPEIVQKILEENESVDSQSQCSSRLDDNRQFQLDISQCGIFLNQSKHSVICSLSKMFPYDDVQCEPNHQSDVIGTSLTHGQNPAFEWNNFSKLSSFMQNKMNMEIEFYPIMKPIDIQIIFAGALHDVSKVSLKKQLIGGYGLEINILTNLEFFFDNCALEFIKSIVTNVNEIFSNNQVEETTEISSKDSYSKIHSLEDFCRMKKIDNFLPCIPINILMTTRKIQILSLLQDHTEQNSSSSVCGVFLSISQPHAILSFKNRENHKFEVAFFDVNLSVTPTHWSEKINFHDQDKPNFWFNREFSILAEMKTVIKSKPGRPNIKTGVPASLITVTFSNFYKSAMSQCKVNVTRHVLVNIDVDDISQFTGFLKLLSSKLQSESSFSSESSLSQPVSSFPLTIFLPNSIALNSELFSISIPDIDDKNKLELKFGPIIISSSLTRNYDWNNLHLATYFKCQSLAVIHSVLDDTTNLSFKNNNFILHPIKIKGKMLLSIYRFNSVNEYWKSRESILEIDIGVVHISLEENQLVFMINLLKKIREILTYDQTEKNSSVNAQSCRTMDKKLEIFYDELRTNKYKLITNADGKESERSHLIADEGTICFSDEDDDLASMLWTYPEPRCIIALEVKPVPFVFIECNIVKDDNYELLQIPCRLEYWNNSTEGYELYKTFNLSENETEKINNFPTVEQLSQSNAGIVVAKSWRVVFDCYARYFSLNDKIKTNSEKAMLVYLSPLVLAASMKIDSCYGSFLIKKSGLKLVFPQMEFSFLESKKEDNQLSNFKPFKSIDRNYEDYSVSDHNILFKLIVTELCVKKSFDEINILEVQKLEFILSNPFLALQLPVAMIEKLNIKYTENYVISEQVSIDMDVCQVGIDTVTVIQLYTIFDKMMSIVSAPSKDTGESNSFVWKAPKILFCNNLDRRIRLQQNNDNFVKRTDSCKSGGIGHGEAVVLRFFSVKQYEVPSENKEDQFTPNNNLELIIGLYSELKSLYRWTEPVELPLSISNNAFVPSLHLGIWKLDTYPKVESSVLANSTTLFNSFYAKNLFYLHKIGVEGLNKVTILGNTLMNNATQNFIQISFSLPSELSSGVSFNVPPLGNSSPPSQYINWKHLSNIKSTFNLSFRIVNSQSETTEYCSLPYQMNIPKLTDDVKTFQQQKIIKLKLYKTDRQVISSRNLSFQFLCTLEWFRFSEADEILLLVTMSPLMIFENLMLHDVKLDITDSNTSNEISSSFDDTLIVQRKGGIVKLMNLFSTDSVKLNASFVNENGLLFDDPLIINDSDVLESLSKKLTFIYDSRFNKSDEKERLNYLADMTSQIVENNELFFKNLSNHNPYSVTVTITPWILVSNKTQLDLVLSLDKNLYYLESNSDFVPSQSDKPMKIGITFENDVFWSKQFLVGGNVLSQIENSFSDVLWNFTKNDLKNEAIFQMNIVVGKSQLFVPLTLKHLFVENVSHLGIRTNKFHHLIIESSVFISNQTDINLDIESLWICRSLKSNIPSHMQGDRVLLRAESQYQPISKFHSVCRPGDDDDAANNNQFILKVNLADDKHSFDSLFNCFTTMDINVLSSKMDSETILATNFIFLKDVNNESNKIGYKAFNVNSIVNLASQKMFIDIFDSKFVPIKVTNWSCQTIMMGELINESQRSRSCMLQIEPMQSVPYWPVDYQMELNKEGCGQFCKPFTRFRVGIELDREIDWSEFFPLSYTEFPSNINIRTNVHKEHLKLVLLSDKCSKIHINIYTEAKGNENSILDNESSLTRRLKISRFSFSLLERQMDLETLIESVRLSVENLQCKLTSQPNQCHVVYELSAHHIQVDNKLFSSGLYDFPVFLNSLTQPNQNFVSLRVETSLSSVYSLKLSFHDELEFFVENSFLYDLLRLFSQFYQCLVPTSQSHSTLPSVSMPILNVIDLNISPISLRMTVHAFLKIYVSCESTSLGLPELNINDCSLRLSTFQKRLWHHYATAVLVRCGCVLGSIELFGNPNGIVRHLSTGFTDLLSSRNIDHGLLVDFLLRIVSFCRHTSGGFISSFTGIASSVSRNLDYFTLDETYITRQDMLRRQSQSNGFMHSFINGLSGFALSILGAVAGLADQPLQASQEAINSNSSLSLAVIKGFGKGLIGVVTKPLSGTAELLAQTGKGLLNTTGIAINRFHSELVPFTLTSKSDILFNVNQLICSSLTDEDQSEEKIPKLLWYGMVVNDDKVPVYLFLTGQYLIEWYIDKPLLNKKSLYPLSNYDISVTSHPSFRQCLKLQYIDKVMNLVSDSNFSRHDPSNYPQNFGTDYRINAFISELQYPRDTELQQNDSHNSSMDSSEYVKFAPVPPATGIHSNSVSSDTATLHSTEINFYSSQCLDGILDALTFLNCQRNFVGDLII